MDEVKDLLMRIEDPVLREQIVRALERRGQITPEALFEEIRRAVDELNTAAALRQLERAVGMPQPQVPMPEVDVVWYGPQSIPGGTGDAPRRYRDSTASPAWYDERSGTVRRASEHIIITSGDTIFLGDN